MITFIKWSLAIQERYTDQQTNKTTRNQTKKKPTHDVAQKAKGNQKPEGGAPP